MAELTGLHASLAASAAQTQHTHAVVVPTSQVQHGANNVGGGETQGTKRRRSKSSAKTEDHQTQGIGSSSKAPAQGQAFSNSGTSTSNHSPMEGLPPVNVNGRGSISGASVAQPAMSTAGPSYSYPSAPANHLPYRNSDSMFAYGPPDSNLGSFINGQQDSSYHGAAPPLTRASYPFDHESSLYHPQVQQYHQHHHPQPPVHQHPRFAAATMYAQAASSNAALGQYTDGVNTAFPHYVAAPAGRASAPDALWTRRTSQTGFGLSPPQLPMAGYGRHQSSMEQQPAPIFNQFFSEQYTPGGYSYQSTLSADQVRTSTLAKAHPLSPSLPSSSHGRPPTSSLDRRTLPPIGSLSRPGTSQGANALPAPLSPTQLPVTTISANQADGGGSRPPTSGGDLGRAFRFTRRSSMLDLPEMTLDNRPASSSMRPPEGAAPSSRAGLPGGSHRGIFDSASNGYDSFRGFSSAGRLNSSSGLSALGDPMRTPSTSYGPMDGAFELRTSPNGASPFRFQAPDVTRDEATTSAAEFFRDRPLTGGSTFSRPRSTLFGSIGKNRSGPREAAADVASSPTGLRGGRLGTGVRFQDELDDDDPRRARLNKRPFTSGDLPPPRFGSGSDTPLSGSTPGSRDGNSSNGGNGRYIGSSRKEEDEDEDAEGEVEGYERPNTGDSRRVSIQNLTG